MKVFPIVRPLSGEHLAATAPRMAVETDAAWRHRLNFWTGRSLTDSALDAEQEHRAARIAWRGRLVTAGVVRGLEATLSLGAETAAPALTGHRLQLLPGYATDVSGEDVLVNRPLDVPLSGIPVTQFNAQGQPIPLRAGESEIAQAWGTDPIATDQPWGAVLLLRPATLLIMEGNDPDDPCEVDPESDAFSDPRWVDSARLRLAMLPPDLLPVSAAPDAPLDASWRNRLVWHLFGLEAAAPWESFPWWSLGVPLGLISFQPGNAPNSWVPFLDSNSVVRTGGNPRPRNRPWLSLTTSAPGAPDLWPVQADLWRARYQEFVEQLSVLPDAAVSDPAQLARFFRFLPPMGLIPKTGLDFLTTPGSLVLGGPPDRAAVSRFFPANWRVEAAPVPIEDLDAALAGSAPLAPYDLASAATDEVRVLVPVPQRVFDPDLLVIEYPDQRVADELHRLVSVRQEWVQRWRFVLGRRDSLQELLAGPASPLSTPASSTPLEVEPVEAPRRVGIQDTLIPPLTDLSEVELFVQPSAPLGVAAVQRLYVELRPDQDFMPSEVEIGWSTAAGEATYTWTEPPLPGSTRSGTGEVPLWLRYEVSVADLQLPAGDILRFRLRIAKGSVAVGRAGAVVPRAGGGTTHAAWWEPHMGGFRSPQGDWIQISSEHLYAPFEDRYKPALLDGSNFQDRILEIENQVWQSRLHSAGNTLQFVNSDIRNLGRMVRRFQANADPVSSFLLSNFPLSLRVLLATSSPVTSANSPALLAALIPALNLAISGGESIFDPERFAQITLSQEALDLIARGATGADRIRLNRLLLEAAYSRELAQGGPQPIRVRGLTANRDELLAKANRADDAISAGFYKTQANALRARQVILGEDAANDLLLSPSLTNVIKSRSSRVAQERFNQVFEKAKRAPLEILGTLPSGRTLSASESGGAGGATKARTFLNFTPLSSNLILPDLTTPASPFTPVQANITTPTGSFTPSEINLNVPASPFLATPAQFAATPQIDDITGAEPEIGQTFEIRNLTIGRRYDEGPVRGAFSNARAGLKEILVLLFDLDFDYDSTDLLPPGIVRGTVTGNSTVSDLTFGDLINMRRVQPALSPTDIVNSLTLPTTEPESDPLDPGAPPKSPDPSVILSRALTMTDAAAFVLRRLEFYVARLRKFIDRINEAMNAVQAQRDAAWGRLVAIDGRLAESRHDVSVGRALWQEEQDRVGDINLRRDALIRDQVTFLAFIRPRNIDTPLRVTPEWDLDSADSPPPVPVCLQRHDDPPEPLESYVRLFRNAPARWFQAIQPRLVEFDTREKLFELLTATQFAASRFAMERASFIDRIGIPDTIKGVYLGGFAALGEFRQRAASFPLTSARFKPWEDHRRDVEDNVALGDLIEGRHANGNLSADAGAELDQIQQVATCLYAEFAAIPAAIRLQWVEQFSQFDQVVSFRDFTQLPQFGGLDRHLRRRLQAFADWLFSRLNLAENGPDALLNDLIRLCLLLASHAPVNRIIAGHLPRPTWVSLGSRLPIRPVDPSLVRVGMAFHVWNGQQIVARGRVADLADGEVSAQVEHLAAGVNRVETTMQVQFVPMALNVVPL